MSVARHAPSTRSSGKRCPVSVRIVYETHAITVDNERGIATGWLPGALSEAGRRGAAELGARRRDDGVDAVFCSDLARAVDTVEIAFGGSGIPVHVDERLRECDYGELNGTPVARLDAERVAHVDVPWPGGESYRDVVRRTRAFLDDLAAGRGGRRVLVVAHAANRMALDHLLRGEPLESIVASRFAWQPGWEYEL